MPSAFNQEYDRLAMLVVNQKDVTLVGFVPASENEPVDLENGFPCAGRWRIDYVDTFDMCKNVEEYVMSVADAMWGTVILDNGDVVTDALLTWEDVHTDSDHFIFGVRNAMEYEQMCTSAFMMSGSN